MPLLAPLADARLAQRREESGLRPLLPVLRAHLLPVCEASGQLMVVTDADGRVLWREGAHGMLRHADRLGFVGGAAWTEGNVGTNAIGTCLVAQQPVAIHAREHYAESHAVWTCAAAPLHDPLTGQLLGVVDLSGAAASANTGAAAIVALAARLAVVELRLAHQERLGALRAVAAPLLARVGGRAVVVSRDGITAAATGVAAPARVALPDGLAAGECWLPTLGLATAEPLPDGWLLRFGGDESSEFAGTHVELDLRGPKPLLRLDAPSGKWQHALTPRHVELVLALVEHPEGRTAAELADDLFADPARTVTVRAELSRLRKTLGPVLAQRPYRFGDGVRARVAAPADRTGVLAASSAPVVAHWRHTNAP